jgi:hypothetical protein
MANFTRKCLSESVNGKGIKVGSSSTTIHTAITGTDGWDEIWIYATNNSATTENLTIEWGTTTASDGNIKLSIPATSGLTLVIAGLILQNSLVVSAFSDTADVVLLTGYTNTIS